MSAVAVTTAGVRRSSVARLLLEGARDITPMVIGIVPFGVAVGAAVGSTSLGSAGLASGPVILAGAAQLAVLDLLDQGAAPAMIVLSALLVNARILLYSASIAPWFAELPLARRLLLAIPVIDQMHFTCVPRFERGDLDQTGRVAYYTGAAVWLVGAWIGAQLAAAVLGAGLPPSAHVEMAAPLALVGLLAKSVVSRPTAAAAGVGLGVSVLAVGLPFHSAVLAATVCGIAAGTRLDRAVAP